MNAAIVLDREAIARACERYAVARLRVFGSVATGRFDPDRSDVDFFVDFLPNVGDLLGNYLALSEELARIVGRKVDLVMSDAVENPYFAAEAFSTAQDVYAELVTNIGQQGLRSPEEFSIVPCSGVAHH